MAKNLKSESLPDIAKIGAEGGKKAKVEEQGVVNIRQGKGDFSDFSFKEGTTNVVKMQDIYQQEKGKEAFKKLAEEHVSSSHAKVKGGAKGKKKASAKKAAKAGKKAAAAEP